VNLDDLDHTRQELRIRQGKGDRARNVPVPEAVWTHLLA
jgi:hypothetical protein